MKIEDIKVGMKVKANKKSIGPESFVYFLKDYPDGVALVRFVGDDMIRLGGEGFAYSFHLGDVELFEEPKEIIKKFESSNLSSLPRIKQIKSKKPITIRALFEFGACEDKLNTFAEIVTNRDQRYGWRDIPAEFAQEVAIKLGFPNWLKDHGFITDEPINCIKNIKIIEQKSSFFVMAIDSKGIAWALFSVWKDGSGFSCHTHIKKDSGIDVDQFGSIRSIDLNYGKL